MLENTDYQCNMAFIEKDPKIKSQLLDILKEPSVGERPGDSTPQSIKDLLNDGYIFFGNIINQYFGHSSVLDLCCGEGKGLKYFGHNASGVDIIENDNLCVFKDDIINPKISNAEDNFDVVTWLQGIEHFTLEDQEKIFNTIKNIYKPDFVLISTINKDTDPWIDDNFILTGKYNPFHLYEFDSFDFQELSKNFEHCIFYSQYWVDGQSVFVSGLYEDAVCFFLVGVSE